MAKGYAKQKMYENDLVKKHRSKKEQTELAGNRNRQTGADAAKKQMKDLFDRVKGSEAGKRRQMQNRAK